MKKKLAFSLLIVLLIVASYFAGPKTALPFNPELLSWQESSLPLAELEGAILKRESHFPLRADNQARIIWADSLRKSEFSILYLHGFSASQGEGAPVHQNIAKALGANLVLARLSGHGYRSKQLSDFSAQSALEDAAYYLAIATKLGDKVIIMGTSTGCTFALNLAALYPEKVEALINLSPNIRVKDPAAKLLNDPWGEQIAEMVIGPERRVLSDSLGHAKYWDTLYTVHALVELQNLLELSMKEETFQKIEQPCLNLCYYKSEEEQDPVVSVEHIEWMHENLASPVDKKRLVKLDKVGNHVLASPIKSRDIAGTEQAIRNFLEEVLAIPNLK